MSKKGGARIELHSAGVQALLKSPEVADLCEGLARQMSESTGVAYEPDVHVGATRVNAAAPKKAYKEYRKQQRDGGK